LKVHSMHPRNPSHHRPSVRVRQRPSGGMAGATVRERLSAPSEVRPVRAPRSAPAARPSQEIRTHDFGKESTDLRELARPRSTFGSAPRSQRAVTMSSTGLVSLLPERPHSSQPPSARHEPQRMSLAEMQRSSIDAAPRTTMADVIAGSAHGGAAEHRDVEGFFAAPRIAGESFGVSVSTTPRQATYRPSQPQPQQSPPEAQRRFAPPTLQQTTAKTVHAPRQVCWETRPSNPPHPGKRSHLGRKDDHPPAKPSANLRCAGVEDIARADMSDTAAQVHQLRASALAGVHSPHPLSSAPLNCSSLRTPRATDEQSSLPMSSPQGSSAGQVTQSHPAANAPSAAVPVRKPTIITGRAAASGAGAASSRKTQANADAHVDLLEAIRAKTISRRVDPASTCGSAWVETAAKEATQWALRNKYQALDAIIESPSNTVGQTVARALSQ